MSARFVCEKKKDREKEKKERDAIERIKRKGKKKEDANWTARLGMHTHTPFS